MTILVVGSQEDTYSSGTPTLSRTINVASGTRTNGFIAVAVNVVSGSGGGGNVTGITWGGAALGQAVETGAPPHSSDWWYLLSPASGTANIVVSFSSSGVNTVQIVVVWGDSDTALTFGDTQTEARGTTDPTDISLVTTETGEICFSAYASADNNVAVSGDTLLQDYASGGNSAAASYLIAGAPGTYVLDWNRNSTGLASPFNLSAFSMYEAGSGDSPTVVLDTADATTFNNDSPTLEFTGSDADGDDITYQIQISDASDFTSGSQLRDNYDGSGGIIHPNPTGTLTWQSENQVDDRPGQSFTATGGILDRIDMEFGPDVDTDGTAVVRVYAHQGTFGTSSEPLNPANPADTPTPDWLTESDGVAYDSGGSSGWHQFDFTGTNRVRLAPGEKYVVIIDWLPNDTLYDNTIEVQVGTGLGHSGNAYIDGAAAPNNGIYTGGDVNFRVYEESVVLDKVSDTDAGFENLDTPADTDPFNESEAAAFTIQAGDELDDGVWFWRVRAIDPAGTNAYGDWSETRSFTVDTAGATEYTKTLIGTVAPGGAMVMQTDKVLLGGIAPVGAMARQSQKAMAGVIAPAGALLNQAVKSLSGIVSPTGSVVRQIGKVLLGEISPSGALATVKTALISLAGTLGVSGALSKQTGKATSGGVGLAGAISKQAHKIFTGSVAIGGALSAAIVAAGGNLRAMFKGMFRGMPK